MNKLIFFILIILLFLSKTQNIFAYQETFTVDNIIIEGNIYQSNYKDKYINIGFRKSFQKLVVNILKTEDQKKILSTDIETIKSLVQNYRIIEEKVSQENYKMKISVSFKEEAINEFFNNKGISYSAVSKLETIIYPIFILNSELQAFSENKFFDEWNDIQEFQDVNFILPVKNLDDLNFIKKNKDNLEEIDLGELVDNYEINNSAILILRYDKNILNIFVKTNFKSTKKFKKIKITVKNLDDKKVREETISKLKFVIHDIWKEQNLVDASAPSYLTVNIMTNDVKNIAQIIKKIENINFIKNFYVKEFDKNNAKIKIKYLGKIKSLKNIFFDNGFILKNENDEWNLVLKG
tara:strand:+ start:63 stop:1115 length:1053 start_codon:yes stop_codon:yes gene_type:complete